MPHLITNMSARQTHPLYRTNCKDKGNCMSSKKREESPEQTTSIPKTYDSIKSAAGADVRPKGAPRR